MRKLLAVATLSWVVVVFLLALLVVLPAPTFFLWLVAVLAGEYSLMLVVLALVGVGLAALALRAGFRRTAILGGLLSAATVVLSLVPVVSAWATARDEGVDLSLREYLFAGTNFSSDREPTETVVYARPEGAELRLDVWLPEGETDAERPAVVKVHGGGWDGGQRGEFPRYNEWLNDEGYAVFDVQYRLAPPPRWRDAPNDVTAAVRWVQENASRYDVDPQRIALFGYSAGGHLALLTAHEDAQDLDVAAVAVLYPPTDLARLHDYRMIPDAGDTDAAIRRFVGDAPDEVPGRYRTASPISHVDPGDPPTFLVHGGRDQLVPLQQSELLAERLREADVEHQFLEIPYAQHAYDAAWGGWGAQITRPALIGFLDRHLAPPERSDRLGVPERWSSHTSRMRGII